MQVAQNGKCAALVRISDDMFAVVMPVHNMGAPTVGIAAWAREPVAVPLKAVA